MNRPGHIFISYKREDADTANLVRMALQAHGMKVWWDEKLQTGQHWEGVIDQALRDASVVVVLWSELAVNSDWVKQEASFAKLSDNLVQARIRDCSIPPQFAAIMAADLRSWNKREDDPVIGDIVAAINEIRTLPAAEISEGGAELKRRVPASKWQLRRLALVVGLVTFLAGFFLKGFLAGKSETPEGLTTEEARSILSFATDCFIERLELTMKQRAYKLFAEEQFVFSRGCNQREDGTNQASGLSVTFKEKAIELPAGQPQVQTQDVEPKLKTLEKWLAERDADYRLVLQEAMQTAIQFDEATQAQLVQLKFGDISLAETWKDSTEDILQTFKEKISTMTGEESYYNDLDSCIENLREQEWYSTQEIPVLQLLETRIQKPKMTLTLDDLISEIRTSLESRVTLALKYQSPKQKTGD